MLRGDEGTRLALQ